VISEEKFRTLFVLLPFVEHLGRVFDRLEKLEVAGNLPPERRQQPWATGPPTASPGAAAGQGDPG
jgi:hypothetical protein